MANFNIDADKNLTYDAIVIGSGFGGLCAAIKLKEAGFGARRLDVLREAPRRAMPRLPLHVWMALAQASPTARHKSSPASGERPSSFARIRIARRTALTCSLRPDSSIVNRLMSAIVKDAPKASPTL